jgi:hypothetical protein
VKKVFTHENRLIVYNLKNLLEEQGIECMVKNEYAGGGVGDLSPFETWPELWVINPGQFELAKENIASTLKVQPEGKSWICKSCGETNESHFKLCWNCSSSNNGGR